MAKTSLKTVNIDLPEWIVEDLDQEAQQLGINRKALINVLLASIFRAKRDTGRKHINVSDMGYLKVIESSFAKEWDSREDDAAFKDL